MHVIISDREPVGHESITVSNTAIGVTASLKSPTTGFFKTQQCQEIFITLETNPIRYTVDGTTPTDAIGHLVSAGQSITIRNKTAIQNFRMIRTGSDATAMVTTFF